MYAYMYCIGDGGWGSKDTLCVYVFMCACRRLKECEWASTCLCVFRFPWHNTGLMTCQEGRSLAMNRLSSSFPCLLWREQMPNPRARLAIPLPLRTPTLDVWSQPVLARVYWCTLEIVTTCPSLLFFRWLMGTIMKLILTQRGEGQLQTGILKLFNVSWDKKVGEVCL